MMLKIGITERGDAALDLSWKKYNGYKILITKNPKELIRQSMPEDFSKSIIHCTITGLAGTPYEPNVISVKDTLDGYNQLVEKFGGERVVLRVDPP